MVLGALVVIPAASVAQVDDAIFNGTVTIEGSPAPNTLVMYTTDPQGAPAGNSTVTDGSGQYEIWVEGGFTYYLYFANGAAMFDFNGQMRWIDHGQTVTVDVDMLSAPAATATLMGFVTNASNPAEPVTVGHVLGMTMSGEQPNYINWTVTNSTGYYQVDIIPGMAVSAVFDAPGYYPGMAPQSGSPPVLGDGESAWLNLSLVPFGGETVFIDGNVTVDGTGTPIADARVEARIEGMPVSYQNWTDALGYYTLNTVEGSGDMTVSATGFTSQREYDVWFYGNMTYDWALRAQNVFVDGYVYDAITLLPIENASVWADSWLYGNRQQYNQSMTDSNGHFSMNVSNGSWGIGAEARGYGSDWESFWFDPLDTPYIEFYLYPERSKIMGYLNDSSTGDPLAGATVRIEGEMGGENGTITDGNGFYEIDVSPDNYRMMFIATGYMWELQQDFFTPVALDETVWVNHSLDPATVNLYGDVSDAVTLAPLDGVEIQVLSFSNDPDYFRMVMSSSAAGQYSVMVAPDPSTYDIARYPGYNDYFAVVDVPDVPAVQHDIYMVPVGGTTDEYLLMGYVTEDGTGTPIAGADVYAFYGPEFNPTVVNSTTTDGAGYYEFWVPAMVLKAMASNYSYLRQTVQVMPGAPGGSVYQNFSLVYHDVPPVIDMTVQPSQNISLIRHSQVEALITEDYLEWVTLSIYRVEYKTATQAALRGVWSPFYLPGVPWAFMPGSEISPGVYQVGYADWDTTIDTPVLEDASGGSIVSGSFWTDMDWVHIEGNYENSSMMSPSFCWAVFDYSGVLVGIDFGSGPDPYAASDPTGEFWIDMGLSLLNLTTEQFEGWTVSPSDVLSTPSMVMYYEPSRCPTGEYVALFRATDQAQLSNESIRWFTVDNRPPVAAAGPDQSEIEGLPVTLDATGSSDDVGIANYTWTFDDGGAVTLYGDVVQHSFSTTGVHTVTLAVTDNGGWTDTDTMQVDVLVDEVPVADAWSDQTEDEDVLVQFDGSHSYDDVGIDNYTWTILDQATMSLVAYMYDVAPTYTFDTPGVYVVELVVTDTASQPSTPDQMLVTVNDLTAPVANAGPDADVGLDDLVALDGSGSSDNSGSIANYTWTFDDGGPVELYGVAPEYTFTTLGQYTITLTVTDGAGLTDTDEVVVTVVDDVPPVAAAGADVTITEGDTVTFDGSGSTDNVGVTNWTWTFTDGVAVTLYGESVDYEFITTGQHIVTLTVSDAEGNTDIDTVVVIVESANEAPVADAGPDQTVVEGEEVTFDGSGSSDDVDVVNYTWTFVYDGETVTLWEVSPEFTFENAGSYIVTLTVEDEEGLTDTDQVTITVEEAEEPAKSFFEQYWWVLVVAVVAAIALVAVTLMMRKGKSGAAAKPPEEAEEELEEPGPPEDEEL